MQNLYLHWILAQKKIVLRQLLKSILGQLEKMNMNWKLTDGMELLLIYHMQ